MEKIVIGMGAASALSGMGQAIGGPPRTVKARAPSPLARIM